MLPSSASQKQRMTPQKNIGGASHSVDPANSNRLAKVQMPAILKKSNQEMSNQFNPSNSSSNFAPSNNMSNATSANTIEGY